MKTRVITAVVGLAFLALVLTFFDTLLFDLTLTGLCLLAIHEVFSAMGFGKKQWYLYAITVPFTLLIMLSGMQAVRAVLLPCSFLVVLFFNVCQIKNVKTIDFGRLSGFVYFSGVLILCFAWGGDTAAYFAGRAFGKHKLAPVVSPHKTVEGAIGGVCGSIAAGMVLTLVYALLSARYHVITFHVQPYHYLILAVMGGIASVLGILGDLFASAVKRQMGIKDYGTIFPGHGGILDRFDSVMFVAPFVSIAVRFFFYIIQ